MKRDVISTPRHSAALWEIKLVRIPCSFTGRFTVLCVLMTFLLAGPAGAFTADSLDITVEKSGDAIAVFRFSLEGMLENAIPQDMLQTELLKGLSTSSEPPELITMDRSTATIRMKKFADRSDVPTGTEYRTASMNFKKAEIALQSSALSSVVTADFSPATMKVTFPDAFERTFANTDVLPSITHTIVDPAKADAAAVTPTPATDGAVKVISSPAGVLVEMDGQVTGSAPDTFTGISAGTHTFRFSKESYEPVSRTVTVKAGQTVQVSVFLAYAEPTPARQSPGFPVVLGIAAILAAFCAGYARKS